MKNLKIVSLLVAVSLIASIMFVPSVGAADVEGLVKTAIGEHRTFATLEQEAEIKAVKSLNDEVVSRLYTQAPWSTILTGAPGLLTSAICEKPTSKRTLTLEFLRGKDLSASSGASQAISNKIDLLERRNNDVMSNYDLDDVSISNSAAKYSELENELTSIYRDYNAIKNDLAREGASLLVAGVHFSEDTSVPVENMFSERITNLFKDINSLMFAGEDTWEAAYTKLLCGENKITMGLILGSEGAAALANEATMQQIFDYLDSSDILETVAGYQAALYSDNFETSKTALYDMLKDVFDDVLNLSGMAPVKTALVNAGWITDEENKIISALKIANDAGDVNFYSRAINLNMILGRYLGIYKNNAKQSPVTVNTVTVAQDEYDICVAKGAYKASVINVLDTVVYMPGGSPSAITTSDNEGKLKFTASESDVADGYLLACYRDGATKNIYNYIGAESLNVIHDDTIHVESVSIKEGHEIEIYEGRNKTLSIIISPSNADDKRVIWSVDDPSIVSVDQDGKITGIRRGETIVTVKTVDGGFTATIKVIVKRSSSNTGGISIPTPTPTIVPVPTVKPHGASYFVDLEGHWGYSDLDVLIKEGIASGYGGGSLYFMPDAPITRAEFATVMCKMMNLPITKGGVNYSDTINHWSRDYVATVTKYGYMIGVAEDLFAPDLIIPREQVIAVILRVIAFQYNVMHEGEEITNDANDILNLVKEYFGYEYTDLSAEIKDIESGSDWARAYVEMAYKGGYVKGYEDHTMRPLNNATRAEAMIMAKRVIMD